MLQVMTKMNRVNLFRNGAEVIRIGEMNLTKGTQTVHIQGITSGADINTVRFYSKEGVVCSNVRQMTLKEEEKKETIKLQETLLDLQKQIEVKQLQQKLWEGNGDFTNRTQFDINEIKNYIDLLPERMQQLNADIQKIEKEINQTQIELEKVSQQESQPILAIDVTVQEDGEYPLEVHYHEGNAWWNTIYELRGDGENPLELRLRGEIHQTTNEDWKQVQIALYSGNPSTLTALPELNPLYVNLNEPVSGLRGKARGFVGMNMAMPEAMEEAGAADFQAVMMDTTSATVKEEETMTQYELSSPKDVMGNGEAVYVDLQNQKIPATYQIITVPKYSPYAFIVATVNVEDMPLPSATQAVLYYKDIYSGELWLASDYAKDQIEITLGQEERLQINRKQLGTKKAKTFLQNKVTEEKAFTTRIKNNSNRELTVLVRDQIPVSEDKEVEVETIELSGSTFDKETGFVEKKITLQAGESEEIKVSYKLTYPKGKQLNEHTKRRSQKYCPTCGAKVGNERFCPECGGVL